MFKMLATALVGSTIALGAMTVDASAASKKYWDDGWSVKKTKDLGSYKGEPLGKIRFLKGVDPSDYVQKGPYGDRDGVYTSERSKKGQFVARFTAFQLYRDDGLPGLGGKGKGKAKAIKASVAANTLRPRRAYDVGGTNLTLTSFNIVGGIASITTTVVGGVPVYVVTLNTGATKGYAVINWNFGGTLYTSALRIVGSPNGTETAGAVTDAPATARLASAGGSDSCFRSPLSRIGAAPTSACAD